VEITLEIWERYDEKATQYIHLEYLCEFVDALEEPLRIAQPNFLRLVVLDVPICEDDRIHCIDILDALTKNFLGRKEPVQNDLVCVELDVKFNSVNQPRTFWVATWVRASLGTLRRHPIGPTIIQ